MSSAKLQPRKHFDAVIWEGDGSTRSIQLPFSPDLVWIKSRSNNYYNYLYDTYRGAGNELFTNATNAASYVSNTLTAFNDNGFSLGTDAGQNANGGEYVAWCWKGGAEYVRNNAGTIASYVSNNRAGGFSVVAYTGDGNGATVGHGLASKPDMIIVKNTENGNSNYMVWHSEIGKATTPGAEGSFYQRFNLDTSRLTANTVWNSRVPDDRVFHVGSDSESNGGGKKMIAYCWSKVPGYSDFGSFLATGGTDDDGVRVFTGFRPKFVLIKTLDNAGDWVVFDTVRVTTNPNKEYLLSNLPNAASEPGRGIRILDSGFQVLDSNNSIGVSGNTYIYMAFAENPNGGHEQNLQKVEFEPDIYETWERKQSDFAVGDSVYQASEEVAETSNITNVQDNADGTQTLTFETNKNFKAVESNGGLVQSFTGSGAVTGTTPLTYKTDMNSVWFDRLTEVHLERTIGSLAGDVTYRDTFTVSYWVKINKFAPNAGPATYGMHWTSEWNGGYTVIGVRESGGIPRWYISSLDGETDSTQYPGNDPELHTWYHVCLSVREGKASLYIDGKRVVYGTNYRISESACFGGLISNTIYASDIYIADAYSVSGKALSPRHFGFTDSDGWYPLPSEAIHKGIKDAGMATTAALKTPIADLMWSETATGSVGNVNNPFYNGFDGDVGTTTWFDGAGGEYTWPGIEITQEKRLLINMNQYGAVFGGGGASESNWFIKDGNGTKARTPNDELISGYVWYDMTDYFPTPWLFTGLGTDGVAANYGDFSLITIGGAKMMDGPSDTRMTWSTLGYSVNNDATRRSWAGAFNGIPNDDYVTGNGVTDDRSTWVAPEGMFTNISSLRLKISSGSGTAIWINGEYQPVPANIGGPGIWVTPNGITDLRNIQVSNNGTTWSAIWAIEVDGKILVDNIDYDRSRVWSANTRGNTLPSYPLSQGFDGVLNKFVYVDNSDGDDVLETNFENLTGSTFRIFAYTNSTGRGMEVNGINLDTISSGQLTGWYNITNICNGQLKSVRAWNSGQGLTSAGWSVIEVDGKILVDNTPFGDIGYHLPFDPTAEGKMWSAHISTNGQWTDAWGNGSPNAAFDGDETTRATVGEVSTYIQVDFPQGTSGRLEVLCSDGRGYNVNGTTVIPRNASVIGRVWRDLGYQKDINYLRVLGNGSTSEAAIHGIKLNGTWLIDHDPVSTDASGNDNHFLPYRHSDTHRTLGNSTQYWSEGLSTSGTYGIPIANIFDGDLGTSCTLYHSPVETVTNKTFTVNENLKLFTRLGHNLSGFPIAVQLINEQNEQVTYVSTNTYGSGYEGWVDTNVQPGTYTKMSISSPNTGFALAAIAIDGQIMIDPEQSSSVDASPTDVYPTLQAYEAAPIYSVNGSLTLRATSPYVGWVSERTTRPIGNGDWYWETYFDYPEASDNTCNAELGIQPPGSGQGDAAVDGYVVFTSTGLIYAPGAASTGLFIGECRNKAIGIISSSKYNSITWMANGVSESTPYLSDVSTWLPCLSWYASQESNLRINFGQRPFQNPLVTNNGDGTVTVKSGHNRSQVWSNYLTSNYTVVDPTNGFDGDTATNAQGWDGNFNQEPPAGFYELIFEPPTPLDGPIEVYLNTAPGAPYDNNWQVDSGSGYSALSNDYTQSSWVTVLPAGQQLHKLRLQGQWNGTSFSAIRAAGSLLIDSNGFNQDSKWSSLLKSSGNSFSGSPADAFDGDSSSTRVRAGGTNTLSIDLSAYNFSGPFRVSTTNERQVTLNGTTTRALGATGVEGIFIDFTDNVGPINTLEIADSGGGDAILYGIEINGALLVDGPNVTGTFNLMYDANTTPSSELSLDSEHSGISESPVGTEFTQGDASGIKVSSNGDDITLIDVDGTFTTGAIAGEQVTESADVVSIDSDNNQMVIKPL